MKLKDFLNKFGEVLVLHHSNRVAYAKVLQNGVVKYYHLVKSKSMWKIIYSI